jgi:sodium transport system permease protein
MMRSALTVFFKELKETLRDTRTLAVLVLVTLMYPVTSGVMLKQQIDRNVRPERESFRVAVANQEQAPMLMAELRQRNIVVVPAEAGLDEGAIARLLRGRSVAAYLRLSEAFGSDYRAMRPARVELWFDSAIESARQREVEDALRQYSTGIAHGRLLAHGVSPAALEPVRVQRYDVGSTAARSAAVISGLLSALFLPLFMLAATPAVDSTAGERERRSLEILMAQPASPWSLIAGKCLVAATIGLAGLVVELLLLHGALRWLPLEEVGLSWRLTMLELAALCVASAPLAVLAAALMVIVGLTAQSFKEAQSKMVVAVLLPMVPGVVVSMLELKTALWMYAVPVLSNQTLLQELAKGLALGPWPFVLTFVSGLLPAALLLAVATWRMKSERFVLGI